MHFLYNAAKESVCFFVRRICAKKKPKSNCRLVLSVVTQNANINLQKSDLFLYNRIIQTWRLCGADVTSVSHNNKINNNGKTQMINTAISKTPFHRSVRPPPKKNLTERKRILCMILVLSQTLLCAFYSEPQQQFPSITPIWVMLVLLSSPVR